jgi:formamidopyrimidine-DNA glycosylase
LVKIIPKVLLDATKKIYDAYPGRINDEVKEFLIIHRKVDALSPTGHPIKIDTKGSRKTYYTDEQVLYE